MANRGNLTLKCPVEHCILNNRDDMGRSGTNVFDKPVLRLRSTLSC